MATPIRSLSSPAGRMQLACFEVRGQVFGLAVQQIREVVRCQALMPLPQAPALVEGLMDLRGAVFPVVDLGRALGLGPVPDAPSARIAVVESRGLVLGLRVDVALEVLGVDESTAEPAGLHTVRVDSDLIRGVVPRADAPPVLVLCLDHLVMNLSRPSGPAREAQP